jgi:hypothetical protein
MMRRERLAELAHRSTSKRPVGTQIQQGATNGPADRQMPILGVETLEEPARTVRQVVLPRPKIFYLFGALVTG